MKKYQLDEGLGGGLRVSSCGLVPENSLRRYLMISRPDSWSDHLGCHLDDLTKGYDDKSQEREVQEDQVFSSSRNK